MKKLLLSVLLLALAGSAGAGVIYDLNTGVFTVGDIVDAPDLVVTAVRYNGFAATELPAGPYTAVWVYSGSGSTADLVPGDVVSITAGTYEEYYDLTELNLLTNGGSFVETGTYAPPMVTFTLSDIMADPEPWESHYVTLTDAFSVVTAPSSYGEWDSKSWDSGLVITNDDYWFDDSTIALWDCYIGVTGMFTYAYGAFRMQPFADGITEIDCSVTTEETSFGAVKALYR